MEHEHTPPRWFARLVGEDNARHIPQSMPYVVAIGPFVGLFMWLAYARGWFA